MTNSCLPVPQKHPTPLSERVPIWQETSGVEWDNLDAHRQNYPFVHFNHLFGRTIGYSARNEEAAIFVPLMSVSAVDVEWLYMAPGQRNGVK